jgi:hypothetical protein
MDKKIERYERLASAIGDRPTIDQINKMIADLRARKAALHPAPEPER